VRTNAFFKSAVASSGLKIVLQSPLSAVQMLQEQDGRTHLGLFSKLGPGTIVEGCGNGFNDRTVKVRANGQFYFVFLEDLESQLPAKAYASST
jgi:hypothetical protein